LNRYEIFYVNKIEFNSPGDVLLFTTRVVTSRLKAVFEIIRNIVMIDLVREKKAYDNELVRQEVIAKALKNYEGAGNV
jgi:hypothetical protein